VLVKIKERLCYQWMKSAAVFIADRDEYCYWPRSDWGDANRRRLRQICDLKCATLCVNKEMDISGSLALS